MTMITSITLLAQEIRRSAARSPLLVKLRSKGGSLGPYSARYCSAGGRRVVVRRPVRNTAAECVTIANMFQDGLIVKHRQHSGKKDYTFVGRMDRPNPHNLRRALLLQQGHHVRRITFPGDRYFLEASIGLFEILFGQLYR
jgi:hypothetical protein